jgi:hypothetical protein
MMSPLVVTDRELGVTARHLRVAQGVTPEQVPPARVAQPVRHSQNPIERCWRALLWNQLRTAGYTDVDFVGGVQGGGCNYGFPYDVDHEGHSGFSATGIADQNQLPPWLAAASPDVVVLVSAARAGARRDRPSDVVGERPAVGERAAVVGPAGRRPVHRHLPRDLAVVR